jgi:hypothetical protein
MSNLLSNELLSQALALPEDARIQLAGQLLASVKPPGALSVEDPGFEAELRRRIKSIDDGSAMLLSADEAIASIRESLAENRRNQSLKDSP